MACCGKKSKKTSNTNLICATLVDVVPGRYQKIIGTVTGISYGWRMDGKVICLDKRDVTDDWTTDPACTRC